MNQLKNILVKIIASTQTDKFKKISTIIFQTIYILTVLNLLNSHPIIGWLLFYAPVFYYLIFRYKAIDILKQRLIPILLTTGAFFYIGNVYAEKILNSEFQIMTEYLKHSTIVLGTMYATIFFMFCLLLYYTSILLFVFLRNYLFTFLQDNIQIHENLAKSNYISKTKWGRVINRYKTKQLFVPFIIIIAGFITFNHLRDGLKAITPNVLLFDAYSYSICNSSTEDHYLYIRKNEDQCYRVESVFPLKYTQQNIEKN